MTNATKVPVLTLHDGVEMPQLGSHLQLGNVVIPKSKTPVRIRQNFELFDFALSEDDMAAIARLDSGGRIGPDPATFSAA